MSQPTPLLAPTSTVPTPSFLDVVLHKGILSLVLHHLPTRSSLRLSEACRTLCHHVRAELQLSLALHGDQGRHLVRLPPTRTFSGAVQLEYVLHDNLGSILSLTAALRHAALKWPRLSRVVLECGAVQRSRREHVDGDDLVLVGPLALLAAAPQLRQLRLVPRAYSPDLLEALGCLTQLTQLSLGVAGENEEAVPVDLRPLTGLTNLLELEAAGIAPEEYAEDYYQEGDSSAAAAAAAAGAAAGAGPLQPIPLPAAAAGGGGSSLGLMPASPSSSSWPCLPPVFACLPSSLTRLDLSLQSDAHSWVPQLVQCSGLQQLSVYYGVRCHHWSLHPCALQAALGPRLVQLTQLTCSTSDDWLTWEEDYGIPPDLADLIIGNELEVLLCEGLKVPVGPYLQALPRLASFCCDEDLTLAAVSVEDWYHLAACTPLRHLRHLTAGVPPPPDMKPLGLTSLSVWVAEDSGWLGGLLRHTPALQRLQVNLTDGADMTDQLQDPASAAAIRASCARLTSLQLINDSDERLACCQALLTCFPSLLSLELDWVAEDSQQLPDLRCLTGLTHLALRAHGAAVQEEDVLSVMWHCTRLASLQVEGVQGVTPRLALMLQHQLPALSRLELVGCGQLVAASSERSTPRGSPGSSQQSSGRSEQERMEQLRQLLRPGLELEVHGDWGRCQDAGSGPGDSGQGHADRLALYLGSYDDI